MSLHARGDQAVGLGFPRVSGDEPALDRQILADVMFSPRERG